MCEEFKKERIDVLGISGGDGTLHHTLTAMIRTYGDEPLPPVAILRGGTMNTIARSFGIFGETPQLTVRAGRQPPARACRSIPWFEREILQVGDTYGFIFGNGIIYNFLHEYYATGSPSPATAAQLILRAAGSTMVRGPLAKRIYKRFHARVVADGDRWACEDFITVAAAVVEQIGLGFKPFYRVQRAAATRSRCSASTPTRSASSPSCRNILAGKPMRRDKVIDQAARHVVFEADEPLEYIIDGDTYVAGAGLKLGPAALRPLTGVRSPRASVPPRCNVV